MDFNPDYLLPGTRIGAYVVHTQIGRGGSGAVYDVSSADANHFALKVCRWRPGPPGSPQWQADKRYSRGIVCMENLRGVRNVAQILAHDRFPDPLHGHQYVVMELVPGSLDIVSWVRRQSPPLVDVVTAFQELAELCGDLAHADIRHRDLKPDNVLMAPGGVPKVVDFESALCFRAEPLTRHAASGLPATRGYQSPELARALLEEKRAGKTQMFDFLPWSDLHALGVIFYEALTGEHPFDITRPDDELLREIAHEDPIHPLLLNGRVPFGLNKVVMKLLAKNPLHRYPHGDRVASDLRALLENVADDSWTEPFLHPTPDDAASMRPRIVTAASARTAEVFTARDAPEPTGVPEPPPAVEPAPPAPVALHLKVRPSQVSRATVAALFLAAFTAGVQGALLWPASPPSPPLAPGPTPVSPAPAPPAVASLLPACGRAPQTQLARPSPRPKAASRLFSSMTACSMKSCQGDPAKPLPPPPPPPREVPTQDTELTWLLNCPREARETARLLDLDPGVPEGDGPHEAKLRTGNSVRVRPHTPGCEVREGPVQAVALMSPGLRPALLSGEIKVGKDRAYFRFDTMELKDGSKHDICAIAAESFSRDGPGVRKVDESITPAFTLDPEYLYITTGKLRIRLAPHLPRLGLTVRSAAADVR